MKEVELKNPFVLDLTHRFDKMTKQFDADKAFKEWLNSVFGDSKISYRGTHRYGLDSSTEESDIIYDDVSVGHNFFVKRMKGCGSFEVFPIEITHKYGYILFWKSLALNETGFLTVALPANLLKIVNSILSR